MKKRGQEFEEEQEGVCGSIWREEIEENVV